MSKIVDAVEAWYRQHGTLHFKVWLGLIALKTHLRDRKLRARLDARKGAAAMADGYRRARAPLGAKAALLASPLSIKSASIFRAREAGTRAFKMRFSRPGMTLERFLRRLLRASDTHCSTLIGFIGMVFGSRPNLSSTAVFVNPAASTVT